MFLISGREDRDGDAALEERAGEKCFYKVLINHF